MNERVIKIEKWHPGAPHYPVTYTLNVLVNDEKISDELVVITTDEPEVSIEGSMVTIPYETRLHKDSIDVFVSIISDIEKCSKFEIPLFAHKELTFEDDFAGDCLDLTKWDYYEEDIITSHPGASQQICCNRSSVEVKDGHLNLTVKKECFQLKDGRDCHYSVGHIWTKDRFAQSQGTFCGRFYFPKKGGINSAFWLTPPRYYGDFLFMDSTKTEVGCNEVDIFEISEYFKKDNQSVCTGLHYWKGINYSNATSTYSHQDLIVAPLADFPDISDTWHDSAFVWTDEGAYIYFDGKLQLSQDKIGPSITEENRAVIILTSGVGSVNEDVPNWYGSMMDDDFPQTFVVDYIKVYK